MKWWEGAGGGREGGREGGRGGGGASWLLQGKRKEDEIESISVGDVAGIDLIMAPEAE